MGVSKEEDKWGMTGGLTQAKGGVAEHYKTPLVCKLIKNALKGVWMENTPYQWTMLLPEDMNGQMEIFVLGMGTSIHIFEGQNIMEAH